jgi:hypothetical protein
MDTLPTARVLAFATMMATMLPAPAPASAQAAAEDRPDAHAPIGVPYAHLLRPGQFMVGYRYDFDRWERLREGTTSVPAQRAFELGYTHAPRAMDGHGHVAEFMYAPTDRLTLLAELPYVQRRMTMVRTVGGETTQSVRGIGDVRIGGLFGLLDREARRAHLSILLGLPTGATGERDDADSAPYAVQPGSGTIDLAPAVTFAEQHLLWSWGGQLGGMLRFGESAEGFTLGNGVDLSFWASRRMLPWASGSVRLRGESWGDVQHDVPQFPASPAAEPGLTGGHRIEIVAGGNLQAAAGIFLGHRLFGEVAVPIYQNLDGPQLGLGWRGVLGWRWLLGQN